MTPEKEPATVTHLFDPDQASTVAAGSRAHVFAPDRNAVPGYELLGELGRGGMGVVYKAKHLGLNREVALKMVLSGAHASPTERNRFRAEAETVARLQHPNVVQVYDVGEADGLPYLSLEICAGSLADKLDGTPWAPERAAAFIATLARAAHAAHTAGVVHRDLKPGNVLLTAEGTPKLTDFGLAKKVGDSGGPTATGAVLGTPSYMAPEQASGTIRPGAPRPRIFGPPTDVYALGAILYELLTGRPPFKASSPLDTLLMVAREEPVAPSRLAPKVPRDLQTVCLKCLEKEPARRYATAAELADDLDRFVRHEPIVARPVPAWERGVKWARRRPAAAALVAVIVAGIATLASLGWYFSGKLRDERDAAMNARDAAELAGKESAASSLRASNEALNARRNNYVLAMGQVQLAWQQGAMTRLRRLLDDQQPRAGDDVDLRGFEWYYWKRAARGAPAILTPEGASQRLNAVAYSRDGRRLIAAGTAGVASIWNVQTQKLERSIPLGIGPVHCLAIEPGQQWIAFGGEQAAAVVHLETGEILRRFGADGAITALAVRGDGVLALQYVRNQALGRIELWNGNTGQRHSPTPLSGQAGIAGPIAFTPDGKYLAVGGSIVRFWDVDQPGRFLRFGAGLSETWIGEFSPDGRFVAVSSFDQERLTGEIRLMSAQSGQVVRGWSGHTQPIRRMKFSADGRTLASAGDDHTVRLWNIGNGAELKRFRTRSRWNTDIALQPGANTLAEVSAAGVVELWPLDFDPESAQIRAHKIGAASMALHADSGRVAAGGILNGVIDDLATGKSVMLNLGQAMPNFRGEMQLARKSSFSPDGRWLAVGNPSGNVSVWNAANGRLATHLPTPAATIVGLSFSGDSRLLAVASRSNVPGPRRNPELADQVVIWDVASGRERRRFRGDGIDQIGAVALSADGRRLLTGTSTLSYRLWDVDSGRQLMVISERGGAEAWTPLAALSRDGKLAAISHTNEEDSNEPTIDLIDADSGALKHTLVGHIRKLRAIAFSENGQRLATASDDETVKVWDVATGQEVLSRPAPRNVVDLGFTSDGKKLLAVGATGDTRVWQGEE